jgi:hypothetical protein
MVNRNEKDVFIRDLQESHGEGVEREDGRRDSFFRDEESGDSWFRDVSALPGMTSPMRGMDQEGHPAFPAFPMTGIPCPLSKISAIVPPVID